MQMLLQIFVKLCIIVVCLQHDAKCAPDRDNSEENIEAATTNGVRHEKWTRLEMMDSNGLYWLQWWLQDKDIHFKVTVNTRGFIGLGFSRRDGRMSSADMVLLWVDDHSGKANALDGHGSTHHPHAAPLQDDTQNYHVIDGYQNATHTYVHFKRLIETCDPYDMPLSNDTIKVLWSFGSTDPIHGNLEGHGQNRGARSLHLLNPVFRKQRHETHQWDITVNNVTIESSMDTLYWCKIMSLPRLTTKHHIVGYEPLITRTSKTHESLVHHMTLFECSTKSYPGSDSASWDVWVKSSGTVCNSNSLTPRDWDSCSTPVAVWSIGASGQFLPEHVGIPMGGPSGVKYYMLEIHYDNPNALHTVDHSGFRVHYSPKLRANDGGIIISGVSISDTQIIPPGQKLYRNVGICGPSCSNVMFPKDGIKIISSTLHSHRAGRKMSLRHVRDGKELDRIVEDDNYDYKYQQYHQLANETVVLPGDYIITDCAYETVHRKRATFGGYSTKQEMCLSFITYYPKIELAGCYSMTPVREFFEMFGVYQFYSLNMTDVENLFLYNGNLLDYIPNTIYGKTKDRNSNLTAEELAMEESLLNKLLISDPVEFHDRTFLSHINQLPWSEPLFTKRVEQAMITGKHMTFCRVSNESMSIPSEIIRYPNFTKFVKPPSRCTYNLFIDTMQLSSAGSTIEAPLTLTLCLLLVTCLKKQFQISWVSLNY
ncbi:MOXD1 homolog 1 [Drosophila sulfurigaster albostrigata]|uniref:MOXD1 homolog 1 n=1 Tax=Drosophila sulfurigaster albostrigata TaxID=89887 RepID=UPI002D21AFCB|nr:MOXD1 homolog 1 [Drosophila sulfurigaster albostrigata]